MGVLIVLSVCLPLMAFLLFKLHYSNNKNKRLSSKLDRLKSAYASVHEDLSKSNDEIEILNKTIDSFKDSEKKILEASEDIERIYQAKIANIKDNSKKLSDQLLQAGKNNSTLLREMEEKTKVYNDLLEANNGLKEQIKDLTKKNLSLFGSAGGYGKQYKDLKDLYDKLYAEYQSCVSKYNELLDEYEKLADSETVDSEEDINNIQKDGNTEVVAEFMLKSDNEEASPMIKAEGDDENKISKDQPSVKNNPKHKKKKRRK